MMSSLAVQLSRRLAFCAKSAGAHSVSRKQRVLKSIYHVRVQLYHRISTLVHHDQRVDELSTPVRTKAKTAVSALPAGDATVSAAGGTNSAAQVLLLRMGLIQHSELTGVYIILPVLQRSLDKLTGIIDTLMRHALGSQKVTLPLVNPFSWWNDSGRADDYGSELFSLQDRHAKRLVLAPTHEEAVTKMGGILSHEFFMPAHSVGEDTILWCEHGLKQHVEIDSGIDYAVNKELLVGDGCDNSGDAVRRICHNCISKKTGIDGKTCDIEHCEQVHSTKAVELAHAFIIGDKYSRLFDANYVTQDGQQMPLIMSCYGIGVTRLLQAVLERAAAESGKLKWPVAIAPYQVCLIGPKEGSKEEKRGAGTKLETFMSDCLSADASNNKSGTVDSLSIQDDVVLDDRSELSIGNRVRQMQRLGMPLILVFGKACVPGEEHGASESAATAQVELLHAESGYQSQLVEFTEAKDAVLKQLRSSKNWKMLPPLLDVIAEDKELHTGEFDDTVDIRYIL